MPLLLLLMQQTPYAFARTGGAWLLLVLYATTSSLWVFAIYSRPKNHVEVS